MHILFRRHMLDIAVFCVVVAARWPALDSYWCLDDWGQLARSAGMIAREPGLPARWLSQDFWWMLTWPAFGLNALPHNILRLFIHGVCAVIISRIARQSTGNQQIGLIAGCLFAVSPIAFTPLYWASGIQELLAGLFALAAVERWWFGGSKRWLSAAGLGIASILAKEPGFGLPILFAAALWWSHRKQRIKPQMGSIVAIGALLIAIGYESVALFQRFSTGEADPYNTGGLSVMLGNIGIFGTWLATPGPFYAANFTWKLAGYGSLLFVAWAIWGIWCWKRGRYLALTALFGALLSLGPSLVLVSQTHPYLAYVAAGGLCLTIAEAIPRRFVASKGVLTIAVIALTALGWWNMHARASAMRDELPADPIIRAIALTKELAPQIRQQSQHFIESDTKSLVIYQPPVSAEAMAAANRDGVFAVTVSERQAALSGHLGPQLILGPGSEVSWRNSLIGVPESAIVMCERSDGFDSWGNTWNALISASLIDMMLGNSERAKEQLRIAAQWDERGELYFLNLTQLRVSRQFILQRLGAFQNWHRTTGQNDHDFLVITKFVEKLRIVANSS